VQSLSKSCKCELCFVNCSCCVPVLLVI